MVHMNEANRAVFEREKDVYRRIWPHDGLVGGVRVGEQEIVMEYLPESLEHYLENNADLPMATKIACIGSILGVMVHLRERHVPVDDMALRTFLLT